MITNFRVFITKHGNGAITYKNNSLKYRVLLTKDDKDINEIFIKHYTRLKSFKHRHYAIAKWIVKEIRAKGYTFKAYTNNNQNIRPIKEKINSRKELYEEQIMENMHRVKRERVLSDFERLVH